MLPGMGDMRAQIESIDERELDRAAAIIQSMTPAERRDPKLLNGSRRARIARGSGTQVSDVNGLVDRFLEARKMMAQMSRGGGMPGMGGMGGSPGMGGMGKKAKGRQGKAPAKAKSRSGNPAKRAQEDAAAARAADAAGANAEADALASFDLPDEFKGLLGPSGPSAR
jgi:signal recognition particle subunit SRP54